MVESRSNKRLDGDRAKKSARKYTGGRAREQGHTCTVRWTPLRKPISRFRLGYLDLTERRLRCISSRVEKVVDAQNYPCGKAIESTSREVAACRLYNEECACYRGEIGT